MLRDVSDFPGDAWITELVKQSLAEDIGSGDVTTAVTSGQMGESTRGICHVVAREPGTLAGLPLLEILFAQLDERLVVEHLAKHALEVGHGVKDVFDKLGDLGVAS